MTTFRHIVCCWLCVMVFFWVGPLDAQNTGCFSRVHDEYVPRDADYRFDVEFDVNSAGDSFSCDLWMRASIAQKALELFRFGVLYDSISHIDQSVKFPLVASVHKTLAVDDVPEEVRLNNAKEFIEFRREHFDSLLLGLVACSNTHNVSIVKSSYGFSIGHGRIWFQRVGYPESPDIKVTVVNLYPLNEHDLVKECAGFDSNSGDELR